MNAGFRQALCGCAIAASAWLIVSLAWPQAASTDDRQPPAAKKGDASKKKADLRTFMRGKLHAADQVLEGLVTEDFALISKGAGELKQIGDAAKWRVSNDAMYRQHSTEFQRKVSQLDKSAKDKQLDGAALAYIDLTMSCVDCHKWVKATLIADLKSMPLNRPALARKP
jgi:hypothetical protein